MTKVYTIHNVVVAEIKVRECAMAKQAKSTNKNIQKMKLVIQETERKTKAWEENCQKIDKEVTLACKKFAEDGITK